MWRLTELYRHAAEGERAKPNRYGDKAHNSDVTYLTSRGPGISLEGGRGDTGTASQVG